MIEKRTALAGIFLILLVVPTGVGGFSSPASKTPPITHMQMEKGTLTGVVKDQDGEPVENASVTVGEHVVVTDENGTFSLSLPPGHYSVVIGKEGYTTYQSEVDLTPGETLHLNATIERLPPFWSDLVVTVRNSTGAAVENATVSITWKNMTAATNSSGMATFQMIGTESVYVTVRAEGYIPIILRVSLLRNTTTHLNVTLERIPPYPVGSLVGRVRDASSGEAMGGASVTLASEEHTFTTETLPNGTFHFLFVPVGNYTLSVSREGYMPYSTSVTLISNTTTTLSVPLQRYPEPTIYGGGVTERDGKYHFEVTYRDPRGRPPTAVYVVIDGEEHEMEPEGGNFSDGAIYSLEIELDGGVHSYYFRVLGPEGEPLNASDDTPYSENTQKHLTVEEKKGGAPYLLLGIAALVIAALIALLLLKIPGGEGVEE